MAKKPIIVEDELTPENVESTIVNQEHRYDGNVTRGYRTTPIVPAAPQPTIESVDGEQE